MRTSGPAATAVIAVIACLTATLGCAATPTPPPPAQATDIIGLLNQKRADAGCPALTPDDRLAVAAGRQAADMRDHGVQDHTGSDGSSPWQRIEAAGFAPAAATGEILLWGTGSTSPPQAVDAWMASPPHREVIEQCTFTHAGAVVLQAESRYFAAVAFATTMPTTRALAQAAQQCGGYQCWITRRPLVRIEAGLAQLSPRIRAFCASYSASVRAPASRSRCSFSSNSTGSSSGA